MSKRFVEVRISPSLDAAELLAHLEGEPPLGAWEDDDAVHLYWAEEHWNDSLFKALPAALEQAGCNPSATECRIQTIRERDWNALWVRSVVPVRIGRRIVIRQSWNPAPLPPDSIELVIDPRRAFGTGHHPTTRLLVEALEGRIRGGESVLDVGTGSGILAMAALRLGARSAVGIDSDLEAIDCAREYAAANGFGSELELRVEALDDLEIGGYDLVLANLDRAAILRNLDRLLALVARNGLLLISGLLAEEREEVSTALLRAGALELGSRAAEEWIAIEVGGAPLISTPRG